MINVFLVDDHELVRTGIKALLDDQNGIEVVGVSDSGETALEWLEHHQTDIILMDINLPGMDGVETYRKIKQQHSDIKIIALTVYNSGHIPLQLLKMGISGFLSKSSPVAEIVDAIQTVYAGQRYLCDEVAENLASEAVPGAEQHLLSTLSQREMEVLSMILQGKSIKDMSDILELSDKTINTYRYRIYKKLKVKNDVELTRLSIKCQLIK